MKKAALFASALLLGAVTLVLSAQENSRPTSAESNSAQAKSTTVLTPGTARAQGYVEVLTDTQGVDFGPYISKMLLAVRTHWYSLIPEQAHFPMLEQGKVSIEFVILHDGKVRAITLVSSSGDVALDRAAQSAIEKSAPFAPLPDKFQGEYLALRFHFYYNPDTRALQETKPDKEPIR